MRINLSMLREIILAVVVVGILSIGAHLLFSSFGFVPTDDGFMLAYSRRILDGQIPYKDFLSAHNMGTPLLFVPFVYWGGDYTFWITRFVVWIEFVFIAWIWTSLFTKYSFGRSLSLGERIILVIIAFFFTAHSFPVMVWYTIDGIFIYSVGLVFCSMNNTFAKGVGYLLIGGTFLIKQNFIFLLPATIFLLGDWRSKRMWFFMLLPSIFYYCFFLLTGEISNIFLQTTSRTEFVQTALKAYWGKYTVPWGILLGFTGTYLLRKNNRVKAFIGFILLIAPIIYSAFYLSNADKFVWDASFLLFGTLIGAILFFFWKGIFSSDVRFLILGLLCSWSVGISGGYNTPALASGILFISLVILLSSLIHNNPSVKGLLRYVLLIVIILLLPITARNFYFIRTHHIYGEPRPATELTYEIGNVLPGGKNLLVSKEIYSQLVDLQSAITIAKNKHIQYAILSSYAGMWVKSEQKNPLLMDYPFVFNNQKSLVEPLTDEIRKNKGKFVIIVDKTNLKEIQSASIDDVFRIALLVPKYYRKIAATKYFVLYQ